MWCPLINQQQYLQSKALQEAPAQADPNMARLLEGDKAVTLEEFSELMTGKVGPTLFCCLVIIAIHFTRQDSLIRLLLYILEHDSCIMLNLFK